MPDHEDRNEIPPGAFAARFVGEKAREVLADEKEIEKLIVAQGDGDEPRRSDRQKNNQAADQVQPAPERPVAVERGIDHQRRSGQHQADQSFGQYRERERRPRGEHPPALLAECCVVTLGEEQTAHADAHPESDAGVQREDMSVEHVPRATAERGGAVQAQQRTAEPQTHVADKQNAQESRQCGPHPCRPMMNAEDRVGGSGYPVLQCRLLEILEAVKSRREPVAADRHLARNFRVSALVRVHQSPIVEIGKPDRGENQQQQDAAAAA